MEYSRLNILIVKQASYFDDLLCTQLNSLGNVQITQIITTTKEYVQAVSTSINSDIHAVLLDDEVRDEMSILDAHALLRLKGYDIPTVLITSNSPTACVVADLDICDTIQKPIPLERLKVCLDKLHVINAFRTFQTYGNLYVPIIADSITQLLPHDILYVESINRLIYVHTKDDSFETRVPIKLYEQYLIYNDFFLTHRSCLINLQKVLDVHNHTVQFKNSGKTAIIAEDKISILLRQLQIHQNKRA